MRRAIARSFSNCSFSADSSCSAVLKSIPAERSCALNRSLTYVASQCSDRISVCSRARVFSSSKIWVLTEVLPRWWYLRYYETCFLHIAQTHFFCSVGLLVHIVDFRLGERVEGPQFPHQDFDARDHEIGAASQLMLFA